MARLEELRETLESSPFFKTHEVRAPAAMGTEGPVGVCGGVGAHQEKPPAGSEAKAIKGGPEFGVCFFWGWLLL